MNVRSLVSAVGGEISLSVREFKAYQTTSHELMNRILQSESDRLHNRDTKMADNVLAIRANVIFVCASVCISKYCDENNEAGTNNRIPVKNSHSHNTRRKNTQPLSNQIKLSNRLRF